MNLGEAWRTLGIARTQESGAIRRAYAARLKELDLDRDAQAYAALRQAREVALRWAAGRSAPAEPEATAEDPLAAQDEAAAGRTAWSYAAPELPGAVGDPALTAALPDDPARAYFVAGPAPALHGEIRDVPIPSGNPFAVPALAELPADAALVQPDRGRDAAFYNLLFPGGEQSDEALGEADLARAEGHFRALLRQAQDGALTLSEATDTWLGDTLARAWPRSAPFVADAAETFGWEGQAGMLGERPTVAFLNARLKGMRFHEKVLQPDHSLHKAWMELSRPGPASWFHRTRTGGSEVERLILGVRQRFPELEHHWDGERVASWEQAPKTASEGGPGIWIWVLIGVGVLRLLSAGMDGATQPNAPPQLLLEDSSPETREALDEAAKAAFGPEMTVSRLDQRNQELAQTFRSNFLLRSKADPVPASPAELAARQAEFIAKMQNLVRERSYLAGQAYEYVDLVKAMKLQLAYLVAAQRAGPEACRTVMERREVPASVTLPPEVVKEEQALATYFLETSQLNAPPRPPRKANISGAIVGQVLKETGLPYDAVKAVLQDKGGDEHRCAVTIALLRTVLKKRGPEQEAILRIL